MRKKPFGAVVSRVQKTPGDGIETVIELKITDGLSRQTVGTFEFTPEAFALMVSGLFQDECGQVKYGPHPERFGLKREHTTVTGFETEQEADHYGFMQDKYDDYSVRRNRGGVLLLLERWVNPSTA